MTEETWQILLFCATFLRVFTKRYKFNHDYALWPDAIYPHRKRVVKPISHTWVGQGGIKQRQPMEYHALPASQLTLE
ncbi:hypothetical protein [Rhodoferax sp.]|uniref:hypothetical protein n=1 Tax=Rhodoferax sp. TaxID=50421 RepID=UPI00374CA456